MWITSGMLPDMFDSKMIHKEYLGNHSKDMSGLCLRNK